MGFSDILKITDKIISIFPYSRKERIRNKIDRLSNEKAKLLKQPASDANSRRMSVILSELNRLHREVKNFE